MVEAVIARGDIAEADDVGRGETATVGAADQVAAAHAEAVVAGRRTGTVLAAGSVGRVEVVPLSSACPADNVQMGRQGAAVKHNFHVDLVETMSEIAAVADSSAVEEMR